MARYTFPAIFTFIHDEDYGDYYQVAFPDIEGCITAGDTLDEAVEMATDALNLMLYDMPEDKIPLPTPINEVKKEHDSDIVTLIMADTVAYKEVIERENNPIAYARKKANMNIKQLAELLGAPYRTVQEWNSGKQFPPKWVERLVIEKIESVTV